MDLERLAELIKQPELVSESDVNMLDDLAEEFPYFQAVKLLKAKALKTSKSIKSAAVLTSDRVLLMKLINSSFDKDVNLPNIDHIDINEGSVNAFSSLSEEQVPIESETIALEQNSADDYNIEASPEQYSPEQHEETLINLEEESDKQLSSVTEPVPVIEQPPIEEVTEEQETFEETKAPSDTEVQQEEYENPEYNLPEEYSTSDNDLQPETTESVLEQIHEAPLADELNLEDEDVFRTELMKSLEDLKRTRDQLDETPEEKKIEGKQDNDLTTSDTTIEASSLSTPTFQGDTFEDLEKAGLSDNLDDLKEEDKKEQLDGFETSDLDFDDSTEEEEDDFEIDSSFFDLNTIIETEEDPKGGEKKK